MIGQTGPTPVGNRLAIKRRFFAIAALDKFGFAGFYFFKSTAKGGALRSGKPFVCVNSTGTLAFYTEGEAQARVNDLLRLGWRDSLDPGYNS